MQYMLLITVLDDPSQLVVSAFQVAVSESAISIKYDVIGYALELGAIQEIFTPPVKVSIEVVTVAIWAGGEAALIVVTGEKGPHP